MNSSSILSRKGLATVAVVLAGTLVLAGCGGGGSDSNSYSNQSGSSQSNTSGKASYGYGSQSGGTQTTNAASATTVKVSSQAGLGPILVNDKGMTLYMFKKDKGGKSSCYGACASAWPPLTTTGKATAKGGAMAGKLGTTKRTDGTTQVTYAGWPLYLYAGDTQPGQANGNDITQFGAQWYALTPAGGEPSGGG